MVILWSDSVYFSGKLSEVYPMLLERNNNSFMEEKQILFLILAK